MAPNKDTKHSLVIVTGLSGAGKSTAMRVFEDLGYCCVDNLPPKLIFEFYSLYEQGAHATQGIVIASDVRSGELFDDFQDTCHLLTDKGVDFRILYLDCAVDVLVNRFKEVRRNHPLEGPFTMEEAIGEEKRRLEPIVELASYIFDTSRMHPRDLKEALLKDVEGTEPSGAVGIKCVSFGFKYGIPLDVDFMFDVRFFPNPFYEESLKPLTGDDQAVYDYVMQNPKADEFAHKVSELLDLTFEGFKNVNKFHLTVAFGCTGGRHRSVAFANRIANHYLGRGRSVVQNHRDIHNPL